MFMKHSGFPQLPWGGGGLFHSFLSTGKRRGSLGFGGISFLPLCSLPVRIWGRAIWRRETERQTQEGGPPGPTWEKSPTPTGRSGSGRAAGRPGLPSATRTRAPGLRKHWGLWLMRPCPSTPASSAGKRTNEPGTKAGLPPKGGQQTVLLFFFSAP